MRAFSRHTVSRIPARRAVTLGVSLGIWMGVACVGLFLWQSLAWSASPSNRVMPRPSVGRASSGMIRPAATTPTPAAARGQTYPCDAYEVVVSPCTQVQDIPYGYIDSVRFAVTNEMNYDVYVETVAFCPQDGWYNNAIYDCWTEYDYTGLLLERESTDSVTVYFEHSWWPVEPIPDYVALRVIYDWWTGDAAEAEAWFNVHILDVTPAASNTSHQGGLCAADCFTTRYAQSTIGYQSLGVSRNVTLIYNGETVNPRPFLHNLVNPSYYYYGYGTGVLKMSAQLDGVGLQFLNGASQLYFAGVGDSAWLGAQFNASGEATGLHWITVTVEDVSWNGDPAGSVTRSAPFVVVNGNASPIARGWGVAGIQRLHTLGDYQYAVIEGDGSYVRFESSDYFYGTAWAAAEAGEFSVLVSEWSQSLQTYLWSRYYQDGTKIEFDQAGYMTRLVGPGGGLAIEYTYESWSGGLRLKTISDPYRKIGGVPAVTTLYYNSTSLDSIVEPGPHGRTTKFTVNGSHHLTHFTDPDNVSTVFTYDGSDRLTKVTDRRGGERQFYYNTNSGLLDSASSPAVPIDQGNGTAVLDTPTTRLKPWQSEGVPYVATSANTPFSAVYDYTRWARVISPAGDTTKFIPDRWGQPMVTVNPLGEQTTSTRVSRPHYVMDTLGAFHMRPVVTPLIKSVTYANGQKDEYGYDFEWLKVRLMWKQLAGESRVWYSYKSLWADPYPYNDWVKRPLLAIGATGDGIRTQDVGYSTADGSYGRPTVVSRRTTVGGVEDWETVSYAYDSVHGRPSAMYDANGQVTTFAYDTIFGNLIRTTRPGGIVERVTLDRYGRDSVMTTPHFAPVRILYDIVDRDTTRTVMTGTPIVTRKQYDALFDTAVVDGKGQRYSTVRDAIGRPIREYAADDTLFRSYRYDLRGRLTSTTNRRSHTIALRYDVLGRLISRVGNGIADSLSYPGGVTDSSMNRIAWNSVATDTAIHKQEDEADNGTFTTTRFATSPTDPFHIYQWDYNYWTGGKEIAAYPYNKFFPVTYYRTLWVEAPSIIEVNGVSYTEEYRDLKQRLESLLLGWYEMQVTHYTRGDRPVQHTFTYAPYDTAFRTAYAYDSLQRIAAVQQKWNGLQRQFRYDSLGRLTTVDSRTQPCQTWPGTVDSTFGWRDTCVTNPTTTQTMTYDAVGNRTDVSATYTAGNRMTAFGPWEFAYDHDGNLTWKRHTGTGVERRYYWDPLNRLIGVVRVGTDSLTYDYDALGRLVRRKTNGTVDRHWLYVGAQIYAELDGVFTVRKQYTYYPRIDQPHSIGNGEQLTLQDAMGNVIGQVDAYNETVTQQVSYDPWGKPAFQSDASGNRLLWKGLYWEQDAALYYVRNRWYDPDIGRFISEDPIGLKGGINLYQFGAGDPINSSDPTGLYTMINCRGISSSAYLLQHCGLWVKNRNLGIDQFLELTRIGDKVSFYQDIDAVKFDARDWVQLSIPRNMTEDAFDNAILRSYRQLAAQWNGQQYNASPCTNSNQFVRQVIAGAGGQIPATVDPIGLAPGLWSGCGNTQRSSRSYWPIGQDATSVFRGY